MKKMKISVTAMILAVAFASCSDDDNNSLNPAAQQIQQTVSTAQSGTWRITSYIDSGNVETNDFTGYNFTFGANNALTAANGASTYTGTWSVTQSNSVDDDDSGDIDFNIIFNAQAPASFLDLNDDWDLVERTATKITLVDISGGNNSTDYLTLEKN